MRRHFFVAVSDQVINGIMIKINFITMGILRPNLRKRALIAVGAIFAVILIPNASLSETKLAILEQSLRAYFANNSDESSFNKVILLLKGTIGSNSGNSACAVYAFGTLQTVRSMPVFISASSKNIQSLKASKDDSIAKTGTANSSKWDEIISTAQVEFQKGLAYRGEVIGEYITSMKSYCK